jgi:hypothetical protein
MAIFRQYIAPLIVVLIFVLSLVVVSARIFLPQDMAAPAPIEASGNTAQGVTQALDSDAVAGLPPLSEAPRLEILLKGLPPTDFNTAPQL